MRVKGEDGWVEYCEPEQIETQSCSERAEHQGGSEHDASHAATILKLRGGAGSVDGRKSARLEDDERVPAAIWYFAGKTGPPPTGKQLRDRRLKEETYVQRKRAEAEARREARKAEGESRKAGVKAEGKEKEKMGGDVGVWSKLFGKKKKKVKTRGDEETKAKESTGDGGGEPGSTEAAEQATG